MFPSECPIQSTSFLNLDQSPCTSSSSVEPAFCPSLDSLSTKTPRSCPPLSLPGGLSPIACSWESTHPKSYSIPTETNVSISAFFSTIKEQLPLPPPPAAPSSFPSSLLQTASLPSPFELNSFSRPFRLITLLPSSHPSLTSTSSPSTSTNLSFTSTSFPTPLSSSSFTPTSTSNVSSATSVSSIPTTTLRPPFSFLPDPSTSTFRWTPSPSLFCFHCTRLVAEFSKCWDVTELHKQCFLDYLCELCRETYSTLPVSSLIQPIAFVSTMKYITAIKNDVFLNPGVPRLSTPPSSYFPSNTILHDIHPTWNPSNSLSTMMVANPTKFPPIWYGMWMDSRVVAPLPSASASSSSSSSSSSSTPPISPSPSWISSQTSFPTYKSLPSSFSSNLNNNMDPSPPPSFSSSCSQLHYPTPMLGSNPTFSSLTPSGFYSFQNHSSSKLLEHIPTSFSIFSSSSSLPSLHTTTTTAGCFTNDTSSSSTLYLPPTPNSNHASPNCSPLTSSTSFSFTCSSSLPCLTSSSSLVPFSHVSTCSEVGLDASKLDSTPSHPTSLDSSIPLRSQPKRSRLSNPSNPSFSLLSLSKKPILRSSSSTLSTSSSSPSSSSSFLPNTDTTPTEFTPRLTPSSSSSLSSFLDSSMHFFYTYFTQHDLPWCRFCGVTESPNWRSGPWGKKTLCNKHGCAWAGIAGSKRVRLDLRSYVQEKDRFRPIVQEYCWWCQIRHDSSTPPSTPSQFLMCYGCQKGFHFLCLNQWYQRPSSLPNRSSRISTTSHSTTSSSSSSSSSHHRRASSPPPSSFSSLLLSLDDIKEPFYCSEVCRHRTVESFAIENETPPIANPLACVSLPPPDRPCTRKRKRTSSSPPSSITTTMITSSSLIKSLSATRKSVPSLSYRLPKS